MKLSVAKILATKLIDEHKLSDWSFGFDNAKTRLGYCSYRKKQITLSRFYVRLNDEKIILNTLLHEIAHVIVGSCNHHNQVWRKKAMSIGCNALRCNSNSHMPERKNTATCPSCGRSHKAHKRSRISCGACCPKFNPDYLLIWS